MRELRENIEEIYEQASVHSVTSAYESFSFRYYEIHTGRISFMQPLKYSGCEPGHHPTEK